MSNEHKIADEQLVKILAGPETNWPGVLYDNYAAIMYGVIFRIVENNTVANEVLLEAFQRIKANIIHFDTSKGSLIMWLLNICRTLALNKRVIKERTFQTKDSIHSYNGVSDKLETDYKVLIDLLFTQGYSQVEVAEELNIPLGTVKTRSRAALHKLQTLIQSEQRSGH